MLLFRQVYNLTCSVFNLLLFGNFQAWKLWNEENIIKLVDPLIYDPQVKPEIMRYAHVGLLCVQEIAQDRPNISTVLSMLSSEIVDLPHPTQPAFIVHQRSSRKISVNDVTVTILDGR